MSLSTLAKKRVNELTEEDKKKLDGWYIRTRGRRALEIDRRRLSRFPATVEVWLKRPNKYDIPDVDTPPKKTIKKEEKRERKEEDDYTKTVLHIDKMLKEGYSQKEVADLLREKSNYKTLFRLFDKAVELGKKDAKEAIYRALYEKLLHDLEHDKRPLFPFIVFVKTRNYLKKHAPRVEYFTRTLASAIASSRKASQIIARMPSNFHDLIATLGENIVAENFLPNMHPFELSFLGMVLKRMYNNFKENVEKRRAKPENDYDRWLLEEAPLWYRRIISILREKIRKGEAKPDDIHVGIRDEVLAEK